MSYHSIEAIRGSCPAVSGDEAQELIEVVRTEEYENGVGRVICRVPIDRKLDSGVTFGCRNITQVESTGCPLRDGGEVKVKLS